MHKQQVSYTLPRNRTYTSPCIRLPISNLHIAYLWILLWQSLQTTSVFLRLDFIANFQSELPNSFKFLTTCTSYKSACFFPHNSQTPAFNLCLIVDFQLNFVLWNTMSLASPLLQSAIFTGRTLFVPSLVS